MFFFIFFYIKGLYHDAIIAELRDNNLKTVKTNQWTEVPASPYAIRVQISNGIQITVHTLTKFMSVHFIGTKNNYLKISNIRGDIILQVKTCWPSSSPTHLRFFNPIVNLATTIFFDCIHPDDPDPLIGNRPKKYDQNRSNIIYNEIGYNFVKPFLDTLEFADENIPSVLYTHTSGYISTEDWCEGDPKPKQYGTKIDSGKIDQEILQELQSQNNASAAAFRAIVSELQSIKTSIAAIASQMYGNVSTITP